MAKPIAADATIVLPHSAEELWPYVTDTDRLDKAVGLPPVDFQRGEAGKGEQDIGQYRWHGLLLARWVEHPFEWEKPKHFGVVRDYTAGPLKRFHGGAELSPVAGGTSVRVFVEFIPRVEAFAPLIRGILIPRALKGSVIQYQAIGDFLDKRIPVAFPTLVEKRTSADVQRLDAMLATLQGNARIADCLPVLRQLIAEAADEDVAGMRPLQIAKQFGKPGDRMLEAFLHATVAGLLEMRWEMLCPGCRGVKADAQHLNELRTEAHCEACNLDFVPDVDDLIEARFYPVANVRDVEVSTFCVTGPAKTPNRLLQAMLDAGETRTLHILVPAGNFILRSPQTRGMVRVAATSEATATNLAATLTDSAIDPQQAALRDGECSFVLHNSTDQRLTVAMDQAHTPDAAATPGLLMAIPAFRSLFSAEALAPGIELQVRRVGLLFTDLAGSTALYERVGDARAFRLVVDHFAILRKAIEEAGGAMIKTIGDAVMAAFPDAHGALDAGLRIQREILSLDARGIVEPAQLVKVGVHSGACFAVTQNERLDYFGTTVNVAARAQGEAHGGEVVVTAEAYRDAADLLEGNGYDIAPFTVTLKGISQPVGLYRITAGS